MSKLENHYSQKVVIFTDFHIHSNLLLYKFSDFRACSLKEGSKKVFDFLRFNKKMHIDIDDNGQMGTRSIAFFVNLGDFSEQIWLFSSENAGQILQL